MRSRNPDRAHVGGTEVSEVSTVTVVAVGGAGMDGLAAEITAGAVFFLGLGAAWWSKVGKRR